MYTSGTSNNWGIDFGSSTSYGIINNNTIYTGGSASGGAGIVFNGLWSNFTNNRVNTSTTGNYNRGFIVYSVGSNSYIANNIINTFGTSSAEGIYLEGPKNVTIFNNTIRTGLGSGGSNYGIDGTAGTNGTVINQNTIYTNGTTNNYGVYLLTQGNNVVSNNTIITNGSGGSDFGIYLMTTSTFNNITGNVITTGRRLQSGSNNNLIRDNIISMNVNSNTNIGINVVASIRNTLINNTIGTKGTSNNYGIRLNTGASYNNLTNNTINSGGTTTLNDGVLIDGGSWNNTLTGNIINTSGSGTAHGIDIRGSNGNVFTMNNISTSGSNSYAIIISNTNWSIFNDTILNNPTQWINTSDVYYSNFTNTTFKTSFGSIDILPLVL
ncbi:right-handed parallel beta-helix repeat-containing protein, partial [Candidatus Pacearchaeota archaeon]|nr:right-handed parallel beta-helix repeat-containing protein [Candidatus Pacearchaeota archaeon]